MSGELTAMYADKYADRIWANANEGAPFGWTGDDGESVWNDRQECIDQTDCADEDIRPAYASEWLDDALDISYTVSGDGSYRSGEVTLGIGGPNVYVNTGDRLLLVAWGDRQTRSLPGEFIDGIDEALAENWELLRHG